MPKKIKVAIVGVGNCASSLIQGLFYYRTVSNSQKFIPGLMNPVLEGYKISDIGIVAAFDVDKRKVGKDVSRAIFSPPNCTKIFNKNIPHLKVIVKMGPVLDGVAGHLKEYPESRRFSAKKEKSVDVVRE